jgi:hypothetical protein
MFAALASPQSVDPRPQQQPSARRQVAALYQPV